MNARYYAFALTGRALTRLCNYPGWRYALPWAMGCCPFRACIRPEGRAFDLKGVHSTCVTCIQPAGRAFYLQDVHSTCLRPKILQPVMVEILLDSYQNIVG